MTHSLHFAILLARQEEKKRTVYKRSISERELVERTRNMLDKQGMTLRPDFAEACRELAKTQPP